MITISESEYLQMQEQINELQQKLALLQDQEFLSKLNLAYHLFVNLIPMSPTNYQSVSYMSA